MIYKIFNVYMSECVLIARMFYCFIFMHDLPSQEHPYLRIACSGKVDAMACSPDGTLCAAGIKEKVYLWEVSEGASHQCFLLSTHPVQMYMQANRHQLIHARTLTHHADIGSRNSPTKNQ